MSDWALSTISLICAVQVWFWDDFVNAIGGPYIEATNTYGFPLIALAIGVILAGAGIVRKPTRRSRFGRF